MEIRETRRGTGWKVELFDGERSISWCSLADCRMRIGESVVAMGGIGGVGTLPEFRRKGYSRQVMEAAIAVMEREKYAISFLHGIQEFYHRFGFITCMAEHEFSLDTRDLSSRRGVTVAINLSNSARMRIKKFGSLRVGIL